MTKRGTRGCCSVRLIVFEPGTRTEGGVRPAGIGLGQLLVSPVGKGKQAGRDAQSFALSPHNGAGGGA